MSLSVFQDILASVTRASLIIGHGHGMPVVKKRKHVHLNMLHVKL